MKEAIVIYNFVMLDLSNTSAKFPKGELVNYNPRVKLKLRKFFQEVGRIIQTVTHKNILTYFGWVFLSFNCVPKSG
jgi:hypothetical protein